MNLQRLYTGNYTRAEPHAPDAQGEGVYTLDFDPVTGALSAPRLAVRALNPSFLACHPDGRTVYAVSETEEGRVVAYRVQGDGSLHELATRPTQGSSPAHVSVHPAGHLVFAVNYAGGESVLAFALGEDGQLGGCVASVQHSGHGPNAERQDGPHPHSVHPGPQGEQVYVMDLGIDEVITYTAAPGQVFSRLHVTKLPGGSGPRHLALDARGEFAFVTLELSSQVALLRRDAPSGEWRFVRATPTVPDADMAGNTPAEVLISADGRFVYVSNRGHDSIAVFAFDRAQGELTLVQHVLTAGRTPRGCAWSPDGRHLLAANQDSSSITVFQRDAENGQLHSRGTFPCPTPTSLCFLPV